jgi:hypothetical protein
MRNRRKLGRYIFLLTSFASTGRFFQQSIQRSHTTLKVLQLRV